MELSNSQYGENKTKKNRKQKITLILFIIVILILGWQVYELISESKKTKRSFPTPKYNHPLLQPASTPTFKKELPSSKLNQDQKLTAYQKQYLSLVSQYQMAKLERQLLEEEVAIATARQQLAQLNQKTQDLLGEKESTPLTIKQAPFSLKEYRLAYLDHQANTYNATLSVKGHYLEITSGTQLENGARVISINNQGVIFLLHNEYYQLTFNGLALIKQPSNQLFLDLKSPTVPTNKIKLFKTKASASKVFNTYVSINSNTKDILFKGSLLNKNALYYSYLRNQKLNNLMYNHYTYKKEIPTLMKKLEISSKLP